MAEVAPGKIFVDYFLKHSISHSFDKQPGADGDFDHKYILDGYHDCSGFVTRVLNGAMKDDSFALKHGYHSFGNPFAQGYASNGSPYPKGFLVESFPDLFEEIPLSKCTMGDVFAHAGGSAGGHCGFFYNSGTSLDSTTYGGIDGPGLHSKSGSYWAKCTFFKYKGGGIYITKFI